MILERSAISPWNAKEFAWSDRWSTCTSGQTGSHLHKWQAAWKIKQKRPWCMFQFARVSRWWWSQSTIKLHPHRDAIGESQVDCQIQLMEGGPGGRRLWAGAILWHNCGGFEGPEWVARAHRPWCSRTVSIVLESTLWQSRWLEHPEVYFALQLCEWIQLATAGQWECENLPLLRNFHYPFTK